MTPKKIGLILVGAIILLWVVGRLVTSASPGGTSAVAASTIEAPGGKWKLSEGHSPMDDSKSVALSLESDDVIEGPVGSSRPTLLIRCKERKTDVYVVTGMAASVEEDFDGGPADHHTIRIRLDQGDPQTQFWYASTNDNGLFAGDGEGLAKQLAGAKTMVFEFTPFDANQAVAKFDLTGLDSQLPKVADACGWSLN